MRALFHEAQVNASLAFCWGKTTARPSMLPTRLVFPSRRTRRTQRRGSSTTIILKACGRCSRRSTVREFLPDACRHVLTVYSGAPARERMIGWYHTGPKLRASDQEINDLLKRYIARPVMVIVDVRPQTVGIPTDAYFAVEEIKDVSVYSTFECPFIIPCILGWHRNAQNIPARTVGH